ncbi:Bug family tripartite tricarboxylate transporter substrate binding protein [Candidimonas nitroreducens]|uniref:ABC transporter substrate-binding protein n=1 Tax=Candidimonas nitroreducens TaxID=683354 RepID=A0A225M1I9_9BURK|nr:tripartite tricarboxylate transporter substrate binding protein [Candidimonas nitroreducens]OWT55204.1 ABC transporter substrate-binding protein [Candidimonas nitroreducens]
MRHLDKLLIAAVGLLPCLASAADYPARPIHLVVPYAAGGGTDTAARILAKKLTIRIGQPVIVENKAGAATQIGTQYVVRSAADGYTLLMGTANLGTNPAFYKHMNYNVQKDLVPIVQVTDVPVYIFASTQGPIKAFDQLLAAGRSASGLSYATAGVGSIPHLTAELFKRAAHLKLQHVPFKGSSEAVIAVSSNQVPISFDNLAPALGQLKGGRIKALAIASEHRSEAQPQVPTLAELGYPVSASSWWGVLAPKGTSPEIIARLNREINAVVQDPEVRKYFLEQGMHPVGGTPQAFAKHIADQTTKWQAIVTKAGIKIGG